MRRLLFFGSDFTVGLTTALTEQILELQKIPEITLTVASSAEEMEPGLHKHLQQSGVDEKIIPGLDVHRNFYSLASEIAALIRERQIDIVNVHNNWQLALVAWAQVLNLRLQKFKIIYTIHGYRHNSPWKSWLAIYIIGGALLLLADQVISMSGFVSSKFWFLRYKTSLVYYLMLKPEFNKSQNEIDGKSLRLVFPAQFRAGKNQDQLIPVIAEYIRQTGDRNIRIILPGEGATLESCKKQVAQAGLQDIFQFPGRLPHRDVIALYEQSNIGLVMTNTETYGRCIAEPFALGRCVITRRTGIAEDIIRNGENGFLFQNDQELLNILLKLHQNPALIERAGNQAFADKKIFSAAEVMKSYCRVLDNALK